MEEYREKLGKPDIRISGLKIRIHGRQFPDSEDYWDVNWIDVIVQCGLQGASVWCRGSIIHLSEIFSLLEDVERFYRDGKGKARLSCIEPELSVELEAKNHGQIEMVVNITPDHLSQNHRFIFKFDQSNLPTLISDYKKVLKKYPIKGITLPK